MKKSYQVAFFLAKYLISAFVVLAFVCLGMEYYLRKVHYMRAQPGPYPCIRGDQVLNHVFQENCEGIALASALKTFKDVQVRTNSVGLRMPEIRASAEKVVIIGDSYTEGFGLENTETFASRLEALWNKKNIQVINGGTLGFSPALYTKYYEAKIRQFHPKLVLLNFDFTDITDTVFYSQQAEFINGKPNAFPGRDVFPGFVSSFIYGNYSAFLRFLHSEVNAWARSRITQKNTPKLEILVHEGEPLISLERLNEAGLKNCWKPYELTARYLQTLKNTVESDGATFAIHMYVPGTVVKSYSSVKPSLSFWQKYEQLTRKDFTWACGLDERGIPIFRELAAKWKVPFFDTSAVVKSHPQRAKLFFDGDAHWTSEGVKVVTAALADPLFRLLQSKRKVLNTGNEAPRPRL
jgi:hypothetical protein